MNINLNDEQKKYIKDFLTKGKKDIEQAYEDNLIFYEDDNIRASEELEIINSILEQF